MFADKLQVLVRKIVAHKPEFIIEANQALKHQFAQNHKDPYFGVIARAQCLSSPDSKSFTQFQGRLALVFNSRGKCTKVVSATSAAVDSEESRDHLSHNSRKRQSKINAQAVEITAVKAELNKALEENKKMKDLFRPEKMIEVISKAVSAITMQSGPKTSKGTQYQGVLNYIGRQLQPNWHVVPMGCCSLVSPAFIVRTSDILRTIVSG